MAATKSRLEELQARVSALERKRFQCPPPKKNAQDPSVIDDSMRRARLAVEEHKIYSAVWKFVPPPYYTWALEQRAQCLNAASIHHLCKSLLLENKKATTSNEPTNPKYVLVVIQYAATLDTKKLMAAIRSLRPVKQRLDENQFDFRIASTLDNDRLTGYSHNSVTPFGLSQPGLPIVLSKAVADLHSFWMGGGHVHLKLAMTTSDFCRALHPIIADISQPRAGAALSTADDD